MNEEFVVTGIKRVIFVGKNEYPEEKTVFGGELWSSELILHLSGLADIRFNGKELVCAENTVRYLPKGKNREYVVYRRDYGECIDIFFDTDRPISEEAFVMSLKNNARIKLLFKKLFSVWVAKNDGYYFESMSLLYKIFAEMQKLDYIPENQYRAVQPAINYIEENFLNEKISISALAEMCRISESYLKKLFIKKFSVPPIKYIIQLKINYACDLLLSERYSVTQVSNFCGYENIHFFSRQFKEYVGVSPTEFQRKYISEK